MTRPTGSGGWPMSVFLTPDLKPFYAGTYFPPTARGGMPGFDDVLRAVEGVVAAQELVERAIPGARVTDGESLPVPRGTENTLRDHGSPRHSDRMDRGKSPHSQACHR